MATFFGLLLGYMRDCFRSHERLKAEILILRHQLNIPIPPTLTPLYMKLAAGPERRKLGKKQSSMKSARRD
jgi:hypothetical protein